MLGKSFQAVILVFIFTVPLLTGAAFAQQPSPQGISLEFTQQPWDATAGCPAAYTVEVMSQEGFQGVVNLTVVDPPDKVNAVFFPNLVEVPLDGEGSSYLAVMVLPDTPQGMTELAVRGASLPAGEISVTSLLTFNVGPPCEKQPRTAVTTTVATTVTMITTTTIGPVTSTSTTTLTTGIIRTQTVTSTIQPSISPTTTLTDTETSIYAWAVGATIIAIILALVLILKNRR